MTLEQRAENLPNCMVSLGGLVKTCLRGKKLFYESTKQSYCSRTYVVWFREPSQIYMSWRQKVADLTYTTEIPVIPDKIKVEIM